MGKVNILTERVKGKEFLIKDMIATRLSKTQFEKLQALNPDALGKYTFTPQSETDFSWWVRITKKLTNRKIVTAFFECDYYGNIKEV